MGAKIDILSFEAGLIDPLVEPRTTAVNHGRGCRRMENMIAAAQGPAYSRPPSKYIASTKSHGQARLLRVVIDELTSYQVEFGNLYCRFYTNSGQVLSGGAAYEVVSPYTSSEVFDLQAYNDAGTVYLAHPDHPPYRLVYAAATSWTLEAVPFTWGPFRDSNIAAGSTTPTVTITPSATSGNITLTASSALFVKASPSHVGALWKIGHRAGTTHLTQTFRLGDGVNQTGASTIAVGQDCRLQLTTQFHASGTLYLERSYDAGGTWFAVEIITQDAENALDTQLIETLPGAIYRFRVANLAWGGADMIPTMDWVKMGLTVYPPTDQYVYGYVAITAVTDSTHASATVVSTLAAATATANWAEGAWSPTRGYPRGVGVFDGRLAFCGNASQPTTIWLSYTNVYTQMATGSTAAHALVFPFGISRSDPFLWFLGEEFEFYVGTPGTLLQFRAADPASAISAVNKPAITRKIKIGCSSHMPVDALTIRIFLDCGRTVPRRVRYSMERDILYAPPLNLPCPTSTLPGIKKIVFQGGDHPVVWMLRDDGWLLGMSIEQLSEQEEVIGFHEHWTIGEIEDVDVMPYEGQDIVWWIAARTVEGTVQRHIERLDCVDWQAERATAHALDGYVEWDGGAAKTIADISVDGGTGRVTVTASGHSLTNTDLVDFADVGGMTWLNSQTLVVADKTDDTFVLKTRSGSYVDGSILPAWTSAGTVRKVTATVTGLAHHEGESVYAVADGNVLGPFSVASGSVSLGRYANHVFVGLFIDAWLQPLRLVLPTPAGSTRGRQMRISTVWVSFYRSWEFEIGPDEDRLETVRLWNADTEVDASPELVTGERLVNVDCGYSMDPTVLIHRHLPLPLCIRALNTDVGVYGQMAGRT